jgi:hypothetical protein
MLSQVMKNLENYVPILLEYPHKAFRSDIQTVILPYS